MIRINFDSNVFISSNILLSQLVPWKEPKQSHRNEWSSTLWHSPKTQGFGSHGLARKEKNSVVILNNHIESPKTQGFGSHGLAKKKIQ